MTRRSASPETNPDEMSVGARCRLLTENLPWQSNEGLNGRQRACTWARRPYRHLLTEYGTAIGRDDASVRTDFFVLLRLSEVRRETDMREFVRYYIVPDGGIMSVTHHDTPATSTPESRALVKEAAQFMLTTGLSLPDAINEFECELALKQADADGSEPYVPS